MNPMKAEIRLQRTRFIVEATDKERHSLWSFWAHQSNSKDQYRPPKIARLDWPHGTGGWGVRVGTLDGRPVVVSMTWEEINGCMIMFWNPTSEVVDYRMIKEWLEEHFTRKYDVTRPARCNAMNFHHCVSDLPR